MSDLVIELIIILLLLVANGVFAMSELAIISARRPRLEQRAEEGDSGAQAALELSAAPDNFLSTVQIGITLIGILSGAVGGATLSDDLKTVLEQVPFLAPYSQTISVGLIVLLITYLSLVIGELAPKRLALNNPEGLAVAMAPTMKTLTRIASPAAHLLSRSTDLVFQLFGVQPSDEPPVTDEDVRGMLEHGTQTGVFDPIEEEIVGQVFRLSDRTVSALFTPRTEIVWLDRTDPPDVIKEKLVESGFARYPVAEGNLDNVIGLVSAQDLLAQSLNGEPLNLESILQPALFIPETTPALVVVERLKQTPSHIALVIDEYGGLEGLVTVDDILSAIVGDIPDTDEPLDAEAIRREDGTWLVDGMFQIDEFQDLFEIKDLPDVAEGYYQTVGGLVMAMLGRIPKPGDHFEIAGYRLEVMDMDGRRVDKVLVTPLENSVEIGH